MWSRMRYVILVLMVIRLAAQPEAPARTASPRSETAADRIL